MMKFSKKSIGMSALFMCLMLTNCTDKDVIQSNVRVQITGELDMPESRTQIDGAETTDGSTGILWSAGDAIGVFGSSTMNAQFKSNNTQPAKKATFSGELIQGDTPLYAYYPYFSQSIADPENVLISLEMEQIYTDLTSIAPYDLKVGSNPTLQNGSYKFSFKPLTALLKFQLNLTGVTGISSNEVLESIAIEPVDGENTIQSPLTGNFNLDLTTQQLSPVDGESYLNVMVNFANAPKVSKVIEGYASIVPNIKKGDKLLIYIITDKHSVSLTVTAQTDFMAGRCYDIPLVVKNATAENNLTIEEFEGTVNEEIPELKAFRFELANNSGKLLTTEAYYNGYNTTTRSITEPKVMEVVTAEDGENTVTGCIPYLYDFTLVPTFEVSEGSVVYVNGVQQTSGESEQDFSKTVTYTVMWEDGSASRDYQVTITNTGLPVVVLTQHDPNVGGYAIMEYLGTNIPEKETDFDDLEGSSTIQIYENGILSLDQTCGFRIRGNSSKWFPKKPMAIKLDDKQQVLDMDKHKRWCLLAGWTDRSMIRNAVAFNLANSIKEYFTNTSETDADGYGLKWNPSGKNVELVLNGVHVGNYFLCEQIKIDSNRLDIKDTYEDVVKDGNTNPSISDCGFLLECDDNYDENYKFETSICRIPFMFKDDVTYTIQNEFEDYINKIESNLYSGNYSEAYNNLHINSFIDWWIVYELCMNYEYRHPKSVYTYKDGDGKLHAGPVWDFDYQTFPSVNNVNNNTDVENSGYNYNNYGSNMINKYDYGSLMLSAFTYIGSTEPFMWYPLLLNDTVFKERVKSRWNALYTSGTLSAIINTIHELAEACKVSDEYNKEIWPMTSYERINYSWFIDCCGDEGLTDYGNVINTLIESYQSRLAGMNSAINSMK